MITILHIKNVGIIDDLSVDLSKGFNVFTGETGAGKTLIIDALSIISGGRFSKEMIRKGEEYSFVELNLFMPDNENAVDGNVIISREIHQNGKNSCKINGRLVTVSELKDFMKNIIDIHGQNDNQKILDKKYHIKYLDDFCGDELSNIHSKYKDLFYEYNELNRELKQNLGDEKEKQRRLDLLQYEFEEIDKADLKVGEEETLNEKRNLYVNSEKIGKSLEEADDEISNSVESISQAIKAMERIENLDEKYRSKLEELRNSYYEIEELSRDISDFNEDMYFDENERNEIEERLDLIFSLKRKYGNSIEEILEYKDKVESEINRINNLDEVNNKIKARLKLVTEQMKEKADKMHELRMHTASILSDKINEELADLEMPNARFSVGIKELAEFNKRGLDETQFFISTNIGENSKELSKIASGGEMSRIMLAIKTALANTDSTPVLVFDEIDTGISGKAAKAVGEKLKLIGGNHQVICITHQPSIAAKGDENYFISKALENERTHTSIKKLNEEEIIDEIARISNGDITDIARKHALELRKSAWEIIIEILNMRENLNENSWHT